MREGTGRHYTFIVHISYKGHNAPDSKILGKHRGNRDFTPRNVVWLAPDNKLWYRWNQGLNKKWEERRALCKGISRKQINSPTAIDTSPKAVNALFLLSQCCYILPWSRQWCSQGKDWCIQMGVRGGGCWVHRILYLQPWPFYLPVCNQYHQHVTSTPTTSEIFMLCW